MSCSRTNQSDSLDGGGGGGGDGGGGKAQNLQPFNPQSKALPTEPLFPTQKIVRVLKVLVEK